MENPFLFLYEKLESIELLLQNLQKETPSKNKYDLQFLLAEAANNSEETFTIKEAAAYLKCSVQTIHNKKNQGLLPYYRSGRIVYFKKSEIDMVAQAVRVDVKTKPQIIKKYTFSNN